MQRRCIASMTSTKTATRVTSDQGKGMLAFPVSFPGTLLVFGSLVPSICKDLGTGASVSVHSQRIAILGFGNRNAIIVILVCLSHVPEALWLPPIPVCL